MSLKFTKNQELILNFFFKHQEESYYLRQLGRELGKKPGVFQRDINKLVEVGYLRSEKKGNSRFFSLNRNHPVYAEMKSIFFKTSGIAGTLKRELAQIQGVARAFIYGSFARGEEKADSDIDLMIIGSADENKILDVISRLEGEFGRPINYGLIGEPEFKRKSVGQDSFFENILKQKRIELV